MRVDHPHVIAPLGWIGEDDRVLFTMRIVSGGSLATLIGDHGPLPPVFTAEILRQVLSGLHAVHSARLIHRDIKPANILLDATGARIPHAYLTDFGIAIDLDGPRFTETGKVNGTPGYLAPELMRLGDITPAVDLYAVGMLGATMLTGMRPREFDISTVPPPGTPERLWNLIWALGHPEPAMRPALTEAQQELSHPELAWRDGAAGDVEVLQQLPPLPRPGRAQSPLPANPPMPHPSPLMARTPPMHSISSASPGPMPLAQAPPSQRPARKKIPAQPLQRSSRWLLIGSTLVVIGGFLLLIMGYMS